MTNVSTPIGEDGQPQTLGESLEGLFDRRVLTVFALGISSGMPWVLFGSAMAAWLVDAGLTRTVIGLFGSVGGVYAINFLWSPLLDRFSAPLLGRLGRRRSWIVAMQIVLFGLTLAVMWTDPGAGMVVTSLLALSIASAGATMDIAIDAYRIDVIPRNEPGKISHGAAAATAGWWAGYSLVGALAFFVSGLVGWQWSTIYGLLAVIWLPMVLITLLAPRAPDRTAVRADRSGRQMMFNALRVLGGLLAALVVSGFLMHGLALLLGGGDAAAGAASLDDALGRWTVVLVHAAVLIAVAMVLDNWISKRTLTQSPIVETYWPPLQEFFARNGVALGLGILGFIVTFKLGEAFLGRMSIVFYKEVGFTDVQIGTWSKLFGGVTTIIFAITASVFNARFGLVRGLVVGGVAMAGTNLMFALIALVGPANWLFAATVLMDNFTTAYSTVAFVAFISFLTSHRFSATQYALMASLGNLGRTLLAAPAGAVVDGLGGNWALFFVLTSLMVVPSLLMLLWITRRLREDLGDAAAASQLKL